MGEVQLMQPQDGNQSVPIAEQRGKLLGSLLTQKAELSLSDS